MRKIVAVLREIKEIESSAHLTAEQKQKVISDLKLELDTITGQGKLAIPEPDKKSGK